MLLEVEVPYLSRCRKKRPGCCQNKSVDLPCPVQWLSAFTGGDVGSIPGPGTKIPKVKEHRNKVKMHLFYPEHTFREHSLSHWPIEKCCGLYQEEDA